MIPPPPGVRPRGFQRPLLAVGKRLEWTFVEESILLGYRSRPPTGEHGLGSTCVAWGGSSVVDVTRAISEDYRRMRRRCVESGRRGRDTVRPPLPTDGGGPPRDNVYRVTGQQDQRSEPSPPTTKVASQREGTSRCSRR